MSLYEVIRSSRVSNNAVGLSLGRLCLNIFSTLWMVLLKELNAAIPPLCFKFMWHPFVLLDLLKFSNCNHWNEFQWSIYKRGFPATELFTLQTSWETLPEWLMHVQLKLLKNKKLQVFLDMSFFPLFFFPVFTDPFCPECYLHRKAGSKSGNS